MIGLTVLVFAIPLTFVVFAITQQDQASSRSVAATQAELGLARLTRDLRQVVQSTTTTFTWNTTSASVSMTTPVSGTGGGSTQTVTWSCTFNTVGSCTRQVGAGTAVSEISGVTGLCFATTDSAGTVTSDCTSLHTVTSPAYVTITLKAQPTSQQPNATGSASGLSNPIVIQDGVDLRNNSL